ncbi:MAG: mitochondrial fission ELM1 family protein [Azospirillaceae bacterium]
MKAVSTWIVTDGKAGMESQCRGLARALGQDPVVKRVTLRPLWRLVSPYLRFALSRAAGPPGDPIAPPWPDLVIATGRQSVAPALAVKRATRGRAVLVQIQNPHIAPGHFDLVVTPRHDALDGPNVLTTLGALHGVSPERLAEAAARHGERLAALPRPRVAVLLGGTNRSYRLSAPVMGDFAEALSDMARREGAGLMITPSRRTGGDNMAILRARLEGLPAEIWDGEGENPYFAYLALADHVIVTCDSVNMVSEAAATGRPVHVVGLEGGNPKFERFHAAMREAGIARPFDGGLPTWSYTPPDDMARAVAAVERLFAARGRAAA